MRYALLLLLATALTRADGANLRDQLQLAEKADDRPAQIEIIRRILAEEPDSAKLHGQLLQLWLTEGDYDMADRTLDDWKDAPENIAASAQATILLARHHEDDAIRVLEIYHQKAPTDLAITRQLSGYLAGSPARQLALLENAPGVTETPDLLVSRAYARLYLQDYTGALADFAMADKLAPKSNAVKSNRAEFDRVRVAAEGIRLATEQLAKNPRDFTALTQRAYWYLSLGPRATPLERTTYDANAALALVADSAAARILLATSLVRSGKLNQEAALKKYGVDTSKSFLIPETLTQLLAEDVKLQKDPKDGKALAARANLLSHLPAQFQLALNDITTALDLDPRNAAAASERIDILVRMGRLDDAVSALRRLDAMNPPAGTVSSASLLIAGAYLKAYRYREALDYANEAITAKPTAEAYKFRASVWERMDRPADAQADIAKATALEKNRR
jgi:tetratricopeptide (TPR) repeat protein